MDIKKEAQIDILVVKKIQLSILNFFFNKLLFLHLNILFQNIITDFSSNSETIEESTNRKTDETNKKGSICFKLT